MNNYLALKKGRHSTILIHPRWPSKSIFIAPITLEKLMQVQSELPTGIELILTRAYEAKDSNLGIVRIIFRKLGVLIFTLIYPSRKNELKEIFGSNGHDVDGTHVDVSISIEGKRARLLTLSVFTPLFLQKLITSKYRLELTTVKETLLKHGFSMHQNHTEALQIHCDLSIQNEYITSDCNMRS